MRGTTTLGALEGLVDARALRATIAEALSEDHSDYDHATGTYACGGCGAKGRPVVPHDGTRLCQGCLESRTRSAPVGKCRSCAVSLRALGRTTAEAWAEARDTDAGSNKCGHCRDRARALLRGDFEGARFQVRS